MDVFNMSISMNYFSGDIYLDGYKFPKYQYFIGTFTKNIDYVSNKNTFVLEKQNDVLKIINHTSNIGMYIFLCVSGKINKKRAVHNMSKYYGDGHMKMFRLLHKSLAITYDDIIFNGNPMLIGAIEDGNLEMLKYLTNTFGITRADITVQENYAFRLASEHGHLEMLKYLVTTFNLTHKDATTRDNYAFRWAFNGGHLEIMKYLVTTCGLTWKDAVSLDYYAYNRVGYDRKLEILKYLVQTFGIVYMDTRTSNYLTFSWAREHLKIK